MIKSISKILYKPTDKLTIKLVVGLLDAKGDQNYYMVTNFNGYDYITLNMSASINIQYRFPTNPQPPWNPQQVLHITVDNIYTWNYKIKQFYSKLQNPDLYTYYKSGRISYNGDESYIMSIQLKFGEYAEFEPGIIFDDSGKELPGILFRINISEYQVELSFDQFEAMIYMFTTINISLEANILLNTKLLLTEKDSNLKSIKEEEKQLKPKKMSKSVFDSVYDKPKEVIDNRPINNTATSLNDLLQ